MVIVLLIIVILVLLFIVFNMNAKLTALESRLESYTDLEDNVMILIENLVVTYTKVLSKIKRIDRLGSFESDDEIGFVFKTIKQTIEDLVGELKTIQNTVNEDKKGDGVDNKK